GETPCTRTCMTPCRGLSMASRPTTRCAACWLPELAPPFAPEGACRQGRRTKRGEERYPDSWEAPDPLLRMASMVVRLYESPKISIAALPGPAVGAGIGIALAADLRIAAISAASIPGWCRLGFSGDFGGTWFLTRGPGRAGRWPR